MAPWVFGVVYCEFRLLGVAMAVLVIAHVLDRWGSLISQPPTTPVAVQPGRLGRFCCPSAPP